MRQERRTPTGVKLSAIEHELKDFLPAGTVIAHYTIEEPIGAGGMGEVYRAFDARLDRRVALKILPLHLVGNDERLRRFVREARSASSLNHPNIITIHEIGESEVVLRDADASARETLDAAATTRVHYIAMELIRGETLRQKFQKRVELSQMLEHLAQAADGLTRAHEAGIVHRDLKPENLMVTDDGFTKVVDFGLVKLAEAPPRFGQAHDAATAVLSATTESGVIVGTVGYMSPEQIEGKDVDHRSDIFSFGCILYEAVTDRHPFRGDSAIDTLHRIVYSEPPPIHTRSVPQQLQEIVRRCLAKKASDRYGSMRELAADLRDARATVSSGHRRTERATRPSFPLPPLRRHHAALIAAATLLPIAIYLLAQRRGELEAPATSTPPPAAPMAISRLSDHGDVLDSAISPDGRYVVYARGDLSSQSLWIRQLAAGSSSELIPPRTVRYHGLGFSIDGNFVEFSIHEAKGVTDSGGGLYQIPLLGGPSRRITDAVDHSAFARSQSGSHVVFTRSDAASREEFLVVRDGKGTETVVARTKGRFAAPAWLGDDIVYAERQGPAVKLVRQQPTANAKRQTFEGWARIDSIAARKDARSIVLTGKKTEEATMQLWSVDTTTGDALRLTNDLFGYRDVSISADGNAIVAIQDHEVSNLWMTPLSASTPVALTSGSGTYDDVAVDESGVVYSRHNGENRELYRYDLATKSSRQLTFDPQTDRDPSICAASGSIVFLSNRSGAMHVWRMSPDGSDPVEVTRNVSDNPACSPDGTSVYFTSYDNAASVWRQPFKGGEPARVGEKVMNFAEPSPDGARLASAYWERPGTKTRLAVWPLAGGEPALFELAEGAVQPLRHLRWKRDASAICYLVREERGMAIWQQPVAGGPPSRLIPLGEESVFSFDWSGDGSSVIFARGRSSSDVIVLRN